jgi:hypothetical protein
MRPFDVGANFENEPFDMSMKHWHLSRIVTVTDLPLYSTLTLSPHAYFFDAA